MEILKETQDKETGDYIWDIEYSDVELKIFKNYCIAKGEKVDELKDNDIIQLAIEGIIKDQMEKSSKERTTDEQK